MLALKREPRAYLKLLENLTRSTEALGTRVDVEAATEPSLVGSRKVDVFEARRECLLGLAEESLERAEPGLGFHWTDDPAMGPLTMAAGAFILGGDRPDDDDGDGDLSIRAVLLDTAADAAAAAGVALMGAIIFVTRGWVRLGDRRAVLIRRDVVAWPGVRRAGLRRQSAALTPGQRRAQRAALI